MSKNIDWHEGTEPLTDEEREWALGNNMADLVEAYDNRLSGVEPEDPGEDDRGPTGDVGLEHDTDGSAPPLTDLNAVFGAKRGVVEAEPTPGQREPEQVEVDIPYSEWPLSELQAEAKKRGVSGSGTKAEIAARLDAWDVEHPTS